MPPPPTRSLLPLLYAISVTGIMANSLLAPAVPDVLDDFGRSDGAAGLLVAAVSLPGIVVAPLLGVYADRVGRRAVLVPCLVVYGACGLLAALAPTYEVLVAARFGMGFGAAGLINLVVVIIGDHFDGERRTTIIGRNSAVLTAGLAVLPLVGGLIADAAGWRWAAAPNGLALVMAAVAWRVLDRGRPPSRGTVREQLGGLGDVLRRPTIVVVLASGCLVFFVVFGAFLTLLPIHLEDEFGLGAGWRGVYLGLPAVAASLVGFNLGRLRRRLGVRPTLVVCGASWVVAFVLIGASPALGLLAAGCLLYGAGEGALIPTLQDVAVTQAPGEHRGAVVAVWVGAARLGQTLGPLGAAALADATDAATALVAGAGVAALLVAAFVLGPIGRRTAADEPAALRTGA